MKVLEGELNDQHRCKTKGTLICEFKARGEVYEDEYGRPGLPQLLECARAVIVSMGVDNGAIKTKLEALSATKETRTEPLTQDKHTETSSISHHSFEAWDSGVRLPS